MEWPPSRREIRLPLAKTGHTHTHTPTQAHVGSGVRVSYKHETLDTLSDRTLAVHTFRSESGEVFRLIVNVIVVLFQLTNMSSHSFKTGALTLRHGLI